MVFVARGRNFLSAPSAALFLALFASQAGVLVLAPVLVDVAREFDVSTAAAGQLRMLAAPLAALAAVVVARAPSRWPLRELLLAGTGLVAAGAVASAASTSLVFLAVAQIPVWVGSALLVTAGVAAAASWSTDADRGRVVGYALAGPPAAWIAGMPVIGLVGEVSWRLAFLAVPLPAAAAAAGALLLRPRTPASHAPQRPSLLALLRERSATRWAFGELLANAAWAGTLVYSGALFVEVHGARATTAGLLLALVAGAYLAGNLVAGRLSHARVGRALLLADVFAGVAVIGLWAATPNLGTTIVLFCVAAYVAAGRTLWGTTHGLAVARGRKLEVGAVRAASTELGYVVGSAAGGVALATGGYALLGPIFGALFLAAAAVHAGKPTVRLARRRPAFA